MTRADVSDEVRNSLRFVAHKVRVPEPPDFQIAAPVPRARTAARWAWLAASAAVAAVVVGGVAIARSQTDQSNGPVDPSTSSVAPSEMSLPSGDKPLVAIVNGDAISFRDATIDSGLDGPLLGASSALMAALRDDSGTIWGLALERDALPDRWGDHAVSDPVIGADGRSATWLAEGPSGLVLVAAIDGPTVQIVSAPIPSSLAGADPSHLTVGMDQLRRAFVGDDRNTWVIDWNENLTASDFYRVEGVHGALVGVFANGIIVKGPDGQLTWGFVSGGVAPTFGVVGSVGDASSLVITAVAVFALSADGELSHLETRSRMVSTGGQSWPVLEPTGRREALDLPGGTNVAAMTEEDTTSVLLLATSPEGGSEVIRCFADGGRCELATTLAPDEHLLLRNGG